ncbi:hypothetical protein PUP72_06910 [Pseudomonas synxantha]|uniref:hypothetical protein n=1 Tax=Pseudomonas synxantha TaxID=47883 RepID=UPI002367C25D|nr:hypothetical protein [Pseudomonas synxantha]MDQ0979423.1 hypothetical protein [Pseudomonas synxantha]WDG43717.1 hypothetical protein PUP72_06910 [Pseudomonas synxantha]
MIIIKLFAVLMDGELTASLEGELLTVGEDVLDLSLIPDGYQVKSSDVECKWLAPMSVIERNNGVLSLTLKLPVSADSPEFMRNPEPLAVTREGPVSIPRAPVIAAPVIKPIEVDV